MDREHLSLAAFVHAGISFLHGQRAEEQLADCKRQSQPRGSCWSELEGRNSNRDIRSVANLRLQDREVIRDREVEGLG